MARVASSIPNLFNGVSQQADTLRLLTQGEEQFNMYPSLVQGLVKRPPLEYVSGFVHMFGDSAMKGTLHVADRGDDTEERSRFLLYVTPDELYIYSPTGDSKAIQYAPGAKDYLKQNNADGVYAIATIADYTFIVNPNVKVRMNPNEKAPGYLNVGMVNIRQASYETDYTVKLTITWESGTGTMTHHISATHTTPSSVGTADNPPPKIGTTGIALALGGALLASAGEDPKLTIRVEGSSIYILPEEGCTIWKFEAQDSRGDTHINTLYRTVKRFSELPEKARHGMAVKVTGSDTTVLNDYYVRYELKDGGHEGVWKECPAPGSPIALDSSTMPHVLVDHGTHYMLQPYTGWGKRTAGDSDTAPDPEFVGQPITGVFQYRNRLGLLSKDVVALSEASEFFNFFPTTVTTSTDSNPIFVSASLDGAPTLNHAIPFNEEVLFFGDRSQFKLVAPEILSPSTAAINTLTKYPVDTDIKPVSNGKNIFFVDSSLTSGGDSVRVYEYFIDADTGTKAAMDITAHVPQYIDKGVTGMTCSPGLSLMCLYGFGSSDIWLYKYYWSGQEKLQSAWFRFNVGDNRKVYGAAFIEDSLYFLLRINDLDNFLYLCKMDFSKTLTGAREQSTLWSSSPFLDMLSRTNLDGKYDHDANETTVVLSEPYNRMFRLTELTILDHETRREIRPFAIDPANNRLMFRGDLRGRFVLMGEKYPAHYTFTRAFVREKSEGGQLTAHAGRLQLQRWRLVLGPTGFIEATVNHEDGREFRYPWNPPKLGQLPSKLGRPNTPESCVLTFPVRANAVEVSVTIRNDSWLPSAVISAEWEGNFTTKGLQRI